jgi:hypothetical protein
MSVELIIQQTDPDRVDMLARRHRIEIDAAHRSSQWGHRAGTIVALIDELAAMKAWEQINGETMQRLSGILMDARLLCSCCGLEFAAIEGAKIGPSNYCCSLCVAEVEQRDREELAEQIADDQRMELMREEAAA